MTHTNTKKDQKTIHENTNFHESKQHKFLRFGFCGWLCLIAKNTGLWFLFKTANQGVAD
jgi:hypothetical protein